jgi:hypothetical protein
MGRIGYANDCAKWFPMPVMNGYVVILPLYDSGITEPDMDCDGIIDSEDSDIDGDGIVNDEDAFPYDKGESVDTDGDGIGKGLVNFKSQKGVLKHGYTE